MSEVLSYLLPGFVEQWRLWNPPIMLWTQGPHYILTNGLRFVSLVLVTPIVEEFFFRGLLLTRWSLKWGVTRGILASAAVFALLHFDPGLLGKFFFSYVVSVLYIHTRSLFIPMSIHMANNGIAWLLAGVDSLIRAPNSPSPLAAFQPVGWGWVLATGLSMLWGIRFTKRHVPTACWRIPYLAAQGNTLDTKGDETREAMAMASRCLATQ